MRRVFTSKEDGFSLIELMIVVGIIGILATMAFPKFQEFQSKARMAEAKTNLAHIYTMQHSYYLENDTFIDFANYGRSNCNSIPAGAASLGFEIAPCGGAIPRYTYNAENSDTNGFDSYAASSPSVCKNGGTHYFGINEDKRFAGPKSCADAKANFKTKPSL